MDEDIFPDLTKEDILSSVREVWDLDGLLPWPKEELKCHTCGNDQLHPRYWRFFKRSDDSRIKHRCDVGMKCTRCSLSLVFGVAVPEEVYESAPERAHQQLWWRDVKHEINFEGDPDTPRFEQVEVV